MQYALGHPKANEVIEIDEKLFDFLRPWFTPYMLQRIKGSLVDSESSLLGVLGPAFLKRGNYSSFVKVLIADIIEEISDAHENEASSLQVERVGSQEVHDETNRLPALYDFGDPIGENVVKVLAGGEGGVAPGGKGDDPAVNLYFQRVNNTRSKVFIAGTFVTPPKPLRMLTGKLDLQEVVHRVHVTSERTRTIRSWANEFCEQAKLLYGLPSPEYAPGKQRAGDLVWIFHGTCVKNLQSFEESRIWLEESYCNDFSRDKAFYVSNSFRCAYEHGLLNVLQNFHDNYVMVYCFLVPFGELEGIVESQSGQNEQCNQSSQTGQKVFLNGTPEWGALLKYNWETPKARPLSPQKDLIIGPIGVVEWTDRGSNR